MPWCPECRTEYDAGIQRCADCGATLVTELPPEDFGRDPVIILRAKNAHEAQVGAATLRSEGIPTYVASPDVYLPQLGNPVASVTPEFFVWVPADAAEDARRVLSQPPVSEEELLEAEQATDPEPDIDEELPTDAP